MNKSKHLSVEKKSRIVTLAEEKYSNCEIVRRVGCSEGSVRNVLKKFKESCSVERKKGSGRPRVTNNLEEDPLKRNCLRRRFVPATILHKELAEIQKQTNKEPCSVRTVQRRL